jgi:S-adenosylmethionine hydrolase
MGEFGPELKKHDCVAAPYDEAKINGSQIEAIVININHFGSINLNIMSDEFDLFGPKFPEKFELIKNNKAAVLHYAKTFGDVKQGEALIMKDDYQRVEVAINQGSFIKKVPLKLGERVTIRPL